MAKSTTGQKETVMEQLTTVTRKGQITVPAEIRRALGIEIGDKVLVSLDEEGNEPRANLRPVRSVVDMTFGAVSPRKRPEDFAELRESFVDAASERDRRAQSS